LMLARAVCASPDLLLVDEPTAQLDLRTAGTVNETLGAIARTGTSVGVATHDPHTRDACTDVIDLDTAVPGGGQGWRRQNCSPRSGATRPPAPPAPRSSPE